MKLLRLFLMFLFAGILFSCNSGNDELSANLPIETDKIADKIAESKLFQTTSLALKDQHALLLQGLLKGATSLSPEEVIELESSQDREAYLKSKNFHNSNELSRVYMELEELSPKLMQELDKVRIEIGEEKFAQVMDIIETKYGQTYKVSAEDALLLVKE